MSVKILIGDSLTMLKTLPDQSVHCVVTSPPYWGLRDYGVAGQLGLEKTPQEFIANMVEVFREVRRVLRDDGTCWVNMGDSYAGKGGQSPQPGKEFEGRARQDENICMSNRYIGGNFKSKDLMGMPWRLAFALQDDGWYLRQDIIWSKPNPMPESVRDRCTKAHEYIFLLSKSERYFYDQEAIAEPVTLSTVQRLAQDIEAQAGSDRVPGKTNGPMKAVRSNRDNFKREGSKREQPIPGQLYGTHRPDREESAYDLETRNKRSVWEITTKGYAEAHFATFPPELPETCIKAGCPEGGMVLDPFFGAGTTGLVADRLQRDCIGIELNPEYAEMARKRIYGDSPLFAEVA